MTELSQNGWTANDRSVIASYALPGGRVALRAGDVSVVLLWCANRWHTTVEPLVWPGVWGYAERTVRGSATDLSNHASGTAIDLNAPEHPLGTAPSSNFTTAQVLAIHAIVTASGGVVRWGGDYTGRKDGMHLEINAGAAAVKAFADKLRAGPPSPFPRGFLMALTDAEQAELLARVRNLDFQLFTGPDPKHPGWATFGGGTDETLTVVDYLRRANVRTEDLMRRLAQIETGKADPTPGAPTLSDGDLGAIAAAVVRLLGQKASA